MPHIPEVGESQMMEIFGLITIKVTKLYKVVTKDSNHDVVNSKPDKDDKTVEQFGEIILSNIFA